MSDLLGQINDVPSIGGGIAPANVTAPPTTTTSAPVVGSASIADKVSLTATANPKATPSEVVGASTSFNSALESAVAVKATQAFTKAAQATEYLNSKSVDYQNYVWAHLPEAGKAFLLQGGYKPVDQQLVSQNPSIWHDILHGAVSVLDTVRHGISDVGAATKDTFITEPSKIFNAAMKPVATLADATQLTAMQGDMARAQNPTQPWYDQVIHQLDVSSIVHNYNSISSGKAQFQPEAVLYVQKQLGITGATYQLLKAYVSAGGAGGPALQAVLGTVPQSERAAAASLIMRSPDFQKAADLLNDSHLSLGQMIFGGLNADQMKQLYPGFNKGEGQIGAAVNQGLAIIAAAGSIATGDPAGDVSLLGSGLEGVGALRAGVAGATMTAGAVGIGGSLVTGKTPDALTTVSPFGLKINPLSGVVDGTFSWYANPLFMGQRALTEYKAGLHGIAGMDGWSDTRALRYYLNVGTGRRFATTFAKAATTEWVNPETGKIAETANLAAIDRAGIKTSGMEEIIRSAYPAIKADIEAGGDGVQPVAEMMASNQAAINVARGNAGMFFKSGAQFPHITVSQAALEDIKGFSRTKLMGARVDSNALSPLEIAKNVYGQAAAQDGMAAAKMGDTDLGPVARFTRRMTTLTPMPFLKVNDEGQNVQLERLLGFSLPQDKIDQIINYYRSIPVDQIALRRQIALSGIKDMLLGAGIGHSEKGQEWLDGWLNRENYSMGDTAYATNPMDPTGPKIPTAILDNQISNTIALPDFKEVYKFAKKAWLMDGLQMGLNSDQFDTFMSRYWKRAMLLRPGFAIRVSLEEVANFMLRQGVAAYVNSRMASSIYDTANTMKELKAAHALLDQQSLAAVLGDAKAANEIDIANLRDALLDDMPDEIKKQIKTPEQLYASVAGWRGVNFIRKAQLAMTPEWLLKGAYNLAKNGVLESAYADHIDAITSHGDTYLGDTPNGKEDSGILMDNGQHLMFKRTGVLSELTPGETQKGYNEFVPKWQMELAGRAGAKISRAADNGYLNGGDDGAIQGVKDFINAKQLRVELADAKGVYAKTKSEYEAALKNDPETSDVLLKRHEENVNRIEAKIAEHEKWLKNFTLHHQTRDGRMVATGQATLDEAHADWARAVVDDMYSLKFTEEPQDFEEIDGEQVPITPEGKQPIRLPSYASVRMPYKIGTRDEDRPIQWTSEEHTYNSIQASKKGSEPQVRLFRAENSKTAQVGNSALPNPGRTWFPSFQQAANRAGVDGEVYHINVPVRALKDHYDFNGEMDDAKIQDILAAQESGHGYGNANDYFESGDVRYGDASDPSTRTLVSLGARGLAPEKGELRRVDRSHAPDKLLIPETVAKVNGPIDFIDKVGEKGMQQFVGRPINWLSRQPLFTYNYALGLRDAVALIKERGVGLFSDEELAGIKAGELPERFDALAHDIAMDRATSETLPYIHNPQMKSYMSVVGRNIAPFWFAQEQFYKRWGRLFGTYPEAWYKLSQTMTGLKSVGFVYTDQYGKDAFVYPGSAAAISMINRVFGAHIDTGMSFSSEVGGLNPTLSSGSALPIPSLGPLITLPMTIAGGMFPRLTGIGNAALGSSAQPIDQTGDWPVQAIMQLVPSWASRGINWINEEANAAPGNVTGSLFMSGAINSAQYLEAAGHAPDYKGMTPSQAAVRKNQYLDQIVQGTRNIILLRAFFGLMAPATPNFTFADTGPGAIYTALLNTMPYDQAHAEFVKLYPNATADTIFESTTSPASSPDSGLYGSGTYVPATQAAGRYITANEPFFKSNPQLAPYTMPASLQKGLFDGTTYTLEKGLNLRFGRSLDDWYQEVKYAEGSNTYYPLESLVQAAESATSATATAAQASLGLTQAQAQAKLGMPGSSEKQIKQVWSDWSKSFKAANPIFAASLSVRGDIATARRNSIVQSLNDAIDKGTLPEGEWSKQISYMMVAYNQVIAAYPAVKGTHQATVNWDAFLKWGNAYAAKFPVVGPFWNGVLMHQKVG